MTEPSNPAVAAALRDPSRIDDAMRRAAVEAVLEHARAGKPIAVWENEQVVWLQPDEVLASLGVKTTNPAA